MPTTNPVPSLDPSDLLFNAGRLDQVVNGSTQYYTDRLGVNRRTVEGINAAADVVLGGLGYAPPVAYAAGISMTLTTQTVEYSGEIYAPKVASLPFTTSTWATDSAKFRLIQGVAAADLAASGGSSMIGYMPAGTGAVATTVEAKLQSIDKMIEWTGSDYLASFFTQTSNALYLYRSNNGVNFSAVRSEPVYVLSGRVLRDPCIMYKDGWWWCVYSNVPSNSDFNTTYFGVAKSNNLIDWQFAFNIDTGVANTWAPEWFVDNDGSVYVVVALSFNTHLIPINLISGTAGTKVSLGIPGNSIDGTIQYENGTYYLFIKNEDTKHIERYTASALTGPYTKTGSGNWAGWGADVEGPSLVKQPDGTWRIYFDGYNVGAYYTSTASSLSSNTWSAKATISQSGTVRHGGIIRLDSVARRTDVDAAQNFGGQAKYLSDGTTRVVQLVDAKVTSPLGSAWMRLTTDADVAIFQSRYTDESGFDFVNRRASGYAAIEHVNGNVVDGIPIKFWGASKGFKSEFPNGILTEAWQTPIFQNGWGNGTIPFAYKANSEGLIKFAGIVAGGTATLGTVIFTLSAGWRPERTVVFPVVNNDTSFGSVGVTTAGDVVYLSGSNVKLDLSSISFYRS